ncbi:helix-turn-helix transcriptional regulator [Cytobacillus oceanisediminis]|uniref:helix-turn-helix domain-containing protein n=1 Tax=Cytobacillus oceanisediminis TaxID=665099 RepID=UPI001864D721|nr:helix-turn-helix transcriptional regulator [Cytobacillus oceanisediminis]QOK28029.1 helix-turn-helix transcriptional regulator [Cytobacillus oceanisediminis]
MSHPGIRIKELRVKHGLSQDQLAEKLNMNRVNISNYERGVITNIPGDVLVKLADILHTNTDYLLGRTEQDKEKFEPELTPKDEKDIQKELQRLIDGLEGKGGYAAFDGQTLDGMDEEDRELLIQSLENSLRLAKRLAKQKFTPNKYRN